MKISVYADGSSHSKGGLPGGWAFVALVDGQPVRCGYGGDASTTNNLMELEAAIQGLAFVSSVIHQYQGAIVELVCDSQYVLGTANGSYSATKNIEKCAELRKLARQLFISTRWVRGHAGDPYNERCDSLAKRGKVEIMQKMNQGSADVEAK
jgi:ribonuclease HI